MFLRRKAYDELLEWKNTSQGTTFLMIEGARRVGKTSLVKEFGKNEYKSCLILDFSVVSDDYLDLFRNELSDLDYFFRRLSALSRVQLHPRESLIVFDEIQLFPLARQSMKVLVEDGRFDYITTGSLLSIRMNVEGILLPSEEEKIDLHPLDFEEYLWAVGNHDDFEMARECFLNRVPLGDTIHRRIMNRFREYLIIGGMPRVVSTFVTTGDFKKVDSEKRAILNLYRRDIGKFAKRYMGKVVSIFDEIPNQLNRKEKVFKLSSLNTNARMRAYGESFFWLMDAKITNPCFNSSDPSDGLNLCCEQSTMKCYMSDTGLLVTHACMGGSFVDKELYRALIADRLHINEGMFLENVTAQLLVACGHRLFFYSRYRKKNDEGEVVQESMEVDFIINRNGRIHPVEVKSSNGSRHTSLNKYRKRFGKIVGEPFVLCDSDLHVKDGITYIPFYMAMFL